MDSVDLETYQVQLAQVELALATDPSNAELESLRKELKELIDLTQAALAQAAAAAAASSSSSSKSDPSRKATANNAHAWTAGEDCLAKYSGDGAWYPARIVALGGSEENRVYNVVFKGYNTTELVKASEIKALPANYSSAAPSSSSSSPSNKRKLTKAEEEDREKKKKKNEKKVEARAAKAKEQLHKQATWQKFAKKAEKKGVQIAGVAGTSIFKTPDNPLGRGVCRCLVTARS
jgi:survival-of-motor-neuron-related-splicing factor 30